VKIKLVILLPCAISGLQQRDGEQCHLEQRVHGVSWKLVFLATSQNSFCVLFVRPLPREEYFASLPHCVIKGVTPDENQLICIFKVTTPRVTKLSKFINRIFGFFFFISLLCSAWLSVYTEFIF